LLHILLLEFEVLPRLLIYNGNDLDDFLGLQVVVGGRALAAARRVPAVLHEDPVALQLVYQGLPQDPVTYLQILLASITVI
jgi:hypothetical protein